MFCVNCGRQYNPADKFCNHCGHPLPSGVGATGASAGGETVGGQPLVNAAAVEIHIQSALLAPPPNQHQEIAPYAAFVLKLLSSSLLISVAVFNVADALARKRWEATTSTAVAMLAAILLARSARKTWGRVIAAEPKTDANLKRRHRNVLATGIVIVVLFFVVSAIVGTAIGQNGAEAAQLNADLEHMPAVGKRISKARTAVEATIPSYVQMYKAIEPDVQDFESTLHRLKTEWGMYDAKFPEQHQQTYKSIVAVETGLRRAELLKQQIAVARQIESLDPSHQWAVWQSQMLPLLAREDALDKLK